MKASKKIISLLVFLCFSSDIYIFAASSNAYSNDCSDPRALGNANSMTAKADSPALNWFNPAGLTRLDGIQFNANLMLELPYYEFDSVYGTTVEGESKSFYIPSFFYTQKINSDFAFGLGFNSPYGLSTEWDNAITNYVATTTELQHFNCNTNIAYSVNDNLSVAAGIDIGYAKGLMEKKINETMLNSYLNYLLTGSSSIVFSNDASSKLKGDDTSIGWNFALLYSPVKDVNIGLSYRSSIEYELEGDFYFNGLSNYSSAIFGGNNYKTNASIEIPIPETCTIGFAYNINEKTVIDLDVEYAKWSVMDEMKVKFLTETNPLRTGILNTGNPADKDWEDTWNYSAGIEHKKNEILSFYCGTRYRPSPIPDNTFEISVPACDLFDFAGGFSIEKNNHKWDFIADYIWSDARRINNTVGMSDGTTINGKYRMNVYLIGIGYRNKY